MEGFIQHFKSEDPKEQEKLIDAVNRAAKKDPLGESETEIMGALSSALKDEFEIKNVYDTAHEGMQKETKLLKDQIENLNFLIEHPSFVKNRLVQSGVEYSEDTLPYAQAELTDIYIKQREKLLERFNTLSDILENDDVGSN